MILGASCQRVNQAIQLNGQTTSNNYVTVMDIEFSSNLSKIKIVGPSYISFYEENVDTIYVFDTQLCAIIAKITLDIKLDFDENYFIDSKAKYLLLSWRGERMFNSQIIDIVPRKHKNFENLKIIGIQEQSFFALGKGKLITSDYIQSLIYRIDFEGHILQILKPIVHQYCYYSSFNNILIYQREINQIKLVSQTGKFMNIHLNTKLIELKQSSIHPRLLLLRKASSAYCSFYIRIKQSLKLIRKKPCPLKDSYQVEIRQRSFICQIDQSLQQYNIRSKVIQQLKNESIYYSDGQLKNLQGVIVHENTVSVMKL